MFERCHISQHSHGSTPFTHTLSNYFLNEYQPSVRMPTLVLYTHSHWMRKKIRKNMVIFNHAKFTFNSFICSHGNRLDAVELTHCWGASIVSFCACKQQHFTKFFLSCVCVHIFYTVGLESRPL